MTQQSSELPNFLINLRPAKAQIIKRNNTYALMVRGQAVSLSDKKEDLFKWASWFGIVVEKVDK